MRMQTWVEMERVEPLLRALYDVRRNMPRVWLITTESHKIIKKALDQYHERGSVIAELEDETIT